MISHHCHGGNAQSGESILKRHQPFPTSTRDDGSVVSRLQMGIYKRSYISSQASQVITMDRDAFFAQLDQLTPSEIESRLSSWDTEQLLLAQEYFAKREQAKQAHTDQVPRRTNCMDKVVTGRTIAAALIALGLVVAALIVRGGYEVAGPVWGRMW